MFYFVVVVVKMNRCNFCHRMSNSVLFLLWASSCAAESQFKLKKRKFNFQLLSDFYLGTRKYIK